MRVIFLGTNGWFDTSTGNTISTLVITKNYNIIFDAGNGISKLSRFIDDAKPSYLFISHFHLDHVEGLHTICLNRFSEGLNIVVHEQGSTALKDLVGLPYMSPLESMTFRSRIIEVKNGEADLPFTAHFLQLQHLPYTQGVRIEVDGKVIAHCLDTGYCRNAVTLAQNSDLLIIECTLRQGVVWQHHLCPELCAKIAQESNTHLLALTHFEGKSYPDQESRLESGKIVKALFPHTIICNDEMELEM